MLLMTERSNLLLSVLEKMMKAAMLRRQTGAVVTSSASLLEEEAIAQSLRFLASPFEPKPPRPPVRRQQQQPLRPVAAERPPCPSRGCSTSASLRPSSLPLRQLGALLLPPLPPQRSTRHLLPFLHVQNFPRLRIEVRTRLAKGPVERAAVLARDGRERHVRREGRGEIGGREDVDLVPSAFVEPCMEPRQRSGCWEF